MLTDEQIAELERLDREATPGPWRSVTPVGTAAVAAPDHMRCYVYVHERHDASDETVARWQHDARLIAAARNALPELVAEVRRLRERNARLYERAMVAEEMISKLHALMQRDETCAACGKPTQAGEDFNGPCVEESAYDCAIRQRDEDRRTLGNVLAVLCGDGGHYQQEHGTAAAIEHGLARFHENVGWRALKQVFAVKTVDDAVAKYMSIYSEMTYLRDEVARQDREMTSCQECCSRERLRGLTSSPADR